MAWYDGLIPYMDGEIGGFLDHLRETGRYEDALIIVTSDHGDGFMEHGFLSHSTTPYDYLVRVPLLVKLPGNQHAGHVVEAPVQLIDVMPTVLSVAGIEAVPDAVSGVDLLGHVEPVEGFQPPELTVSEVAFRDNQAAPHLALRRGSVEFIRHLGRRDRIFDLATDPGEQNDLSRERPEELARFQRVAEAIWKVYAQRDQERVVVDAETREELRALGYVE